MYNYKLDKKIESTKSENCELNIDLISMIGGIQKMIFYLNRKNSILGEKYEYGLDFTEQNAYLKGWISTLRQVQDEIRAQAS